MFLPVPAHSGSPRQRDRKMIVVVDTAVYQVAMVKEFPFCRGSADRQLITHSTIFHLQVQDQQVTVMTTDGKNSICCSLLSIHIDEEQQQTIYKYYVVAMEPSRRFRYFVAMEPSISFFLSFFLLCPQDLTPFLYTPHKQLVSQLEFNVPFQHKYGYIRDERSQFIENTVEPSVFLPRIISLVIMCIGII